MFLLDVVGQFRVRSRFQGEPQIFKQRRLAATASTYDAVEVRGEVHNLVFQERRTLHLYADDARMSFVVRRPTLPEVDARLVVQEGLPQRLNRRFRHLEPAVSIANRVRYWGAVIVFQEGLGI